VMLSSTALSAASLSTFSSILGAYR
jgi:hypothetical protein